jgi:hypothetical protein
VQRLEELVSGRADTLDTPVTRTQGTNARAHRDRDSRCARQDS